MSLSTVGRSVIRFLAEVRISDMLRRLLYHCRYGSMCVRILGWRVSSFWGGGSRAGDGLGARAGAGHCVGGGPGGASWCGAPYITSSAAGDNHLRGNVAHWMRRALWIVSVMPSRNYVEK